MKALEKQVKKLAIQGKYSDILENCDYNHEAYKVYSDNVFRGAVQEKRGFV